MKSKTSFCNGTILRSDITRFAPVWILYTVGFLLIQLVLLGKANTDYIAAISMRSMLEFIIPVNGLYAILVALVLFGDLLNPRLCSSIHAMPLTRDDFFCTHAFAGFCFSIIPNALVILVSVPLLGKAAPMAMYLFAVAVGTYVLYFGTAMLAVQLAGNRIAAVLIYGILHFVSVLAIWFAKYLYEPLLYGVEIPIRATIWKLCPTVSLIEKAYIYVMTTTPDTYPYERVLIGIRRVGGWGTLAVWTVVGFVCLAAAQILYRRRKLEVAGDLLAYKKLEPVFLLIYTLAVGGFFHVVSVGIMDGSGSMLFLLAGIAVGWFTGKMLLMRQVNVFRWKSAAAAACLMAIVALSTLACVTDVFGLVHKTVRAEEIDYVQVKMDGYWVNLREAKEIQDALKIQTSALAKYDADSFLEKYAGNQAAMARTSEGYTDLLMIFYLTNGKQMERTYCVQVNSEDGKLMNTYLSSPEAVFGIEETTAAGLQEKIRQISICGNTDKERDSIDDEEIQGLVEAVLADCTEGTMNPLWVYHRGEGCLVDIRVELDELEKTVDSDLRDFYTEQEPEYRIQYLHIRPSNTHSVAWLLENGYVSQKDVDQAMQEWQDFLNEHPKETDIIYE